MGRRGQRAWRDRLAVAKLAFALSDDDDAVVTRSFLPGPARQIGYVVRDIDEAIASWLSIGVGPWFTMRDLNIPALFRGEQVSTRLSLAFSNVGDLQIELINQLDDSPSVHKEFLDSGSTDPSGYNQFAWWVDNYDEVLAAARAAGWDISWEGAPGTGARYFYAQVPGTPMRTIEVMENAEQVLGMANMVRAAVESWDGVTEPVRSLF
jgi:hypothetical protein